MLGAILTANSLELNVDISITSLFYQLSNYLLAEAESGGEEKATIAALVGTAGIIFIFSVILGEICVRLKLPTVLGDLVAGMLLGGSILGFIVFSPEGIEVNGALLNGLEFVTGASSGVVEQAYRFQMKDFLESSANIGLLALLFTTGLESDLKELIRVGTQATTVAITGVAVPFVLGAFVLIKFFGVATIPALFAGAALT
ncbi:MAG: cation:proton antiporter, partial [Cyanobacteria bacterium J06628_3]